MSITIRRLRAEDLGPVAKLHRESFPSFFLSELGERFLREFYRGFQTRMQLPLWQSPRTAESLVPL